MTVKDSPDKDSPEALESARLRAAFAEGITDGSAEALLRARDAGMDWETATRAVAEGLAERYGAALTAPAPPVGPSRLRTWRLALATVVAYALLRPLLGLGHELAVAGLAVLLNVIVGSGVWEPLIRLSGLDPIYTGAAIRAIGAVQVAGVAVASPIGSALHWLLPVIFLPPEKVATGAGISMVATPGAPALGQGIAAFGADIIWLAIGLAVFWRWRRSNWRLALLGLLIQAQMAVNHLLDAHLGLADLDASGVPFALQLAVPNGGWFTSGLATWSGETRDLVIGTCLVLLGYAMTVPLVWLAVTMARVVRPRRGHVATAVSVSPPSRWPALLGALSLALITAWSPIGALAVGSSNWQMSASALDVGVRHPTPQGGRPVRQSHSLRVAGATPVSIEHVADGKWHYVVDGTLETIRGVGYNPQYAGLNPVQRAAMYDRDFADMHRLGVNTIEGWFETQFDSVTLDSAARNGIGVMMPFELNQDWDYTNPNVTASILDHVSAYVETYKDHPAVRMWAPGNENMHRILFAHLVSQLNDPTARARAQAFAAFLPVLVDRIHALDPNHPVVYRDAEDLYLPWITAPFLSQTGVDRPWLVYGANVYSTPRLQQIVSNWPTQWPGTALLISEFAPGGVGPAERPLDFQQEWDVIRSRPDIVLGGLAYTWATNGPEDLDRVFGLVDPNGVPTDGALAALSAVYQSDSTASAETPPAN